ncbi:MAG: NAD(P)/FAD-dependent oxidoreductase [Miltoncostaeaceae bacterium]
MGAAAEHIDVAVVGGGPAGLQAALVLARTRKDVVVFDAPAPPRNAASHGVHNYLGLDDLLPSEIRERSWAQIHRYGTARLVGEEVVDMDRAGSGDLVVRTDAGRAFQARHALLACGYHDHHPDIDGFAECWADTIIPCPFCDGYENRDRAWGIVPSMAAELDVFPAMVRNWTDERMVIAPRSVEVSPARRAALGDLGVPLHVGDIVGLDHLDGKVSGVRLDSGERIAVETLLWTPDEEPTPLILRLAEGLGLELDENGHVAADDAQHTNVDRLWAAGDVQGWMGAIESATLGGMAAFTMVKDWYSP